MRFAAYIVIFLMSGLLGCAATGLREVPDSVVCGVRLHVDGKLLSDSNKTHPLEGAVVKVINTNGEVREYLTDNNGSANFSITVPTTVHTSSVTYELPIEVIEISKQGYFTEKITNSSGFSTIFNEKKWHWGDDTHDTVNAEISLSPDYKKKIMVTDRSNNPVSQAKVTALSDSKIVDRWYTDQEGIAKIDLVEACNYSDDCETLVDKDGYLCITDELGYRCFEDDILNLHNVYVKMTDQDAYIRNKCCPLLDKYVSRGVSLELGYWIVDLAKKYNMRLDKICVKDYKGQKYLSVDLSSKSNMVGNRLSDYDVAKKYFLLLVIDYIKSPSYATPDNSLDGFNINLNTEVSYHSENGEPHDKSVYELEYYFSASDANKFLNQEISRQKLADRTTTISRGDLIELILR